MHVYSEAMLQNDLNTRQTLNLELDGKSETSHSPTNDIAMELINKMNEMHTVIKDVKDNLHSIGELHSALVYYLC